MPTGDDLLVLGLTLKVALTSTLVVTPLGVLLAWGLARWRGAGSGVVETILSLPLVLPPTAVGLVLLRILSPRAAIGGALASLGLDVVFTWRGAVVATAVMSFPLMVRAARTSFEEVDPRLVDVARTLGCSSIAAFRRVMLPLAWRGVTAGVLLAFARALGEFGATILVAGSTEGKTQTLALAIFHRAQTGDDDGARRLVLLTVAIAFVAVWTTEALTRRRARRFAR